MVPADILPPALRSVSVLGCNTTQRNPPATARFGDAYFPDSSSLVPIHPSKWRRPAPKGSPFTLVPSRFWLLRLLGYLPRKPVKQLRPGPPASPSRLGPIFIDGPEVPLPLCFSVHGAGGRLHDWMAQSLFVFFPLRVPRFKGVGACVEPGSAAHMLGEPGGLLWAPTAPQATLRPISSLS